MTGGLPSRTSVSTHGRRIKASTWLATDCEHEIHHVSRGLVFSFERQTVTASVNEHE
jgi:hypothetical protein